MNQNSEHGSGAPGSSHGGGGLYGGDMYGNDNRYRGGHNGVYGSSGMYGGGMSSVGGGSGGPMGGYGPGGSPYGPQDPNNPSGGNPPPRSGYWISFLHALQRVTNYFGRLSVLFAQNAQAFHIFLTALIQLFDRSSVLYGELARFALWVLGIGFRPTRINPPPPDPNRRPANSLNENHVFGREGAPAPSGSCWNNVWDNNANN